jgi:Secretion system C-terminal sorting domain
MRHIIPLFLLLLSQISMAQTPTFNKKIIFRDSLDMEYASQLAETSDGYLVMGTSHTWNKVYSSDTRLVVLKLSPDGAILKKKIYGDSLNWYECPYTKAIMKTGDGNFILLVQHYTSEIDWKLELMKLTPEGDSLWTHAIHIPDGFGDNLFPTTFTQTPNKDFIILGQYGFTGIMIRTDSLCNVKWAKLTGENSIHSETTINSVAALPDNSILLGYYVCNGQGGWEGSGVIAKVDSAGSFKWWRNIGNRPYNGSDQVFVSVTKDNSILALATTYFSNPAPAYQTFELMKLTTENLLLSDTVFGPKNPFLIMYGSASLPDSTIIACGLQGTSKGCIFNCTTDAKTLFYRELTASVKGPSHNEASGSQVILSILPTSDDGLLMAGYYSYPGSYDEDPWILKTDRYGCFQPGCDPWPIYITKQPSSQAVCKGDTAVFGLVSSGDSISFQWQMKTAQTWITLYDGNLFKGTKTDTLRLLNSGLVLENSLFRCRLVNPHYTLYSHTAQLSILHAPSVTVEPNGQWVAPHNRAVFIVQSAGSPQLSYQWFFKNMPLPGATDSIFVIDPVDEEDSPGPYHCMVSNQCGLVSSRDVYLFLYGQGTADDKLESSVNVFPNPAGSKVTIRIQGSLPILTSLKIINTRGEIIRESEFSLETILDISSLIPGLYIIEFNTNGQIIHRRLIVN